MTHRLTPSVAYQLLIMYGVLLQHLVLYYTSGVQSIMRFFLYGQGERLFVTELNNKHLQDKYFKRVF